MKYYLIHHKNPLENYDTYVGSCQNFDARWSNHQCVANSPHHVAYNRRIYQHMRDNGGTKNYAIALIDSDDLIKGQDDIQIANKEKYYAKYFDATLNVANMSGLGLTSEGRKVSKRVKTLCRLGCGKTISRGHRYAHENNYCANR